MTDKKIFKIKLVLGILSLFLLLIGSGLLFNDLKTFLLAIGPLSGIIIYGGIFRTLKTLKNKNTQIIYKGFEILETFIYIFIIIISTIMLLIFYPHISLLFFGLTIATMVILGGLKFIKFDFDNKTVEGLFGNTTLNISKMTVNIDSRNSQIEIRSFDHNFNLENEMFSYKVWTQLIDNFNKFRTN